ncbi:MAG: bifunctional biotin--[acetyl-CoA-carboxylase] ligase/biotin operon repressor BirA [Chromatiaceae bacterium]
METHLRLVRQLADGQYHSGETLASTLGLSRAAIWKAVRKASERLGLEIESRQGKGYRLAAALELLDPERLLGGMSPEGRRRISRLELFVDIDSTNAYLLHAGQTGAPTGTLCLAERQTAGRGRRGRAWVSPFGTNLYLSLLWRYPGGPGELGGLGLAAGAALAQVLEEAGVVDIGLKWPNDLLWRRRKLGGLLLEVTAEAQGPSLVVVGLGLNTHLGGDQGQGIDQPWVDLDEILGPQGYSRNQMAAHLAEALTATLEGYGREGLAPFLPLWERYDLYRGEEVEIRLGDRLIQGIQTGITDQGTLRLEVAGETRIFNSGEVSLRLAQPETTRPGNRAA